VGLESHINIGVRHILPIYMGFSILAAIAALRLLELSRLGLSYSYLQIQPWPEHIKPAERVGKGVLLWYFPYPAHPQ
jgi:hypothetical protein